MELKRFLPVIDSFHQRTVLVAGDLILDEYLLTSTGRVSREAPVLVTDFESSHHCLGGAGNVIMNLHKMGARALPAGFIGADRTGDLIMGILEEAGIPTDLLIRVPEGVTPKKSRILAGAAHTRKQQILRIDYTSPLPIDSRSHEEILQKIAQSKEPISAVILSDYLNQSAPGFFAGSLSELRKGIPVISDSRRHFRQFTSSSYITPNEEEFCSLFEQFPRNERDFQLASEQLIRDLNLEGIILKRGHLGMMICDKHGGTMTIPVHGTNQIVDVTGAGDTVISVATLALCSGMTLFEAAALSNVAASLVVMREGTYALGIDELKNEIQQNC